MIATQLSPSSEPSSSGTIRRSGFYKFADANGPIEVQLAVSRDGINWNREDRSPYLPMGLSDEWDRWLGMMGSGMVRRGRYLYQYYWSPGRLHDGLFLRPENEKIIEPRAYGLGALRQRLDGWSRPTSMTGAARLPRRR
jgi:hypothetical protein